MPRSLFIASILLGAAGMAHAQQSPTSQQLAEVEDESMMVEQFNLSVDEIEDGDIKNARGEDIGEIDEVLADDQGEIMAVSAEVGGFLGIGEREVVIRLDQLRREGDHFTADLSREQLEGLQTWDD